jgi:hypothetical protein
MEFPSTRRFFKLLPGFLLCLFCATAAASSPRVADCMAYYSQAGEKLIAKDASEGPVLYLPALDKTRDFDSMTDLTVVSYNVENLETRDDAMKAAIAAGLPQKEVQDQAPKPGWARDWVARQILGKKPDLVFLDEVHGFHSLDDFAAQNLQGDYRPLLIHGNDSRIDIGILVRKDLPLDVEVQSHADRTFFNEIAKAQTPVYHRDAPMIFLRRKGASEADRPLIAIGAQHLKSQINSEGDPHSVYQRTMEAKNSLAIGQAVEGNFSSFPWSIMGDFNNDVRTAPEFSEIRSKMQSAMDLAPSPIPLGQRITQYSFKTHVDPKYHDVPWKDLPPEAISHSPFASQLDNNFVNSTAASAVKDAGILPYIGADGKELAQPLTYEERDAKFPSDHRAIYTVYDFLKLRQLAGIPLVKTQ